MKISRRAFIGGVAATAAAPVLPKLSVAAAAPTTVATISSTGMSVYGDISTRTAAWAAQEMLKHAEPLMLLNKLGMEKRLPRNGDVITFRRPISLKVGK